MYNGRNIFVQSQVMYPKLLTRCVIYTHYLLACDEALGNRHISTTRIEITLASLDDKKFLPTLLVSDWLKPHLCECTSEYIANGYLRCIQGFYF